MNSIYENILELPLFQGLTRAKFTELIEKIPLHFVKYSAGEHVTRSAEQCKSVTLLLSGNMQLSTSCPNYRVTVQETIHAPNIFALDYLFGTTTCYPFSAQAITECCILQISKENYTILVQQDDIILMNVLNMLSRSSQLAPSHITTRALSNVADRLALYIFTLTHANADNIKILFKQKDLCKMLGTNRATLLSTLETLKQKKLITYTASEIATNCRNQLLSNI